MRLIGNKTRLLDDIEGILAERGISGGTFIDIFSGTGSVGRHFKSRGFRVLANDRLSMCFVKGVADIEVSRYPRFERLRRKHRKLLESRELTRGFAHQAEAFESGDSFPLAQAVHLLDRFAAPREGIVFRSFAPGGGRGRMYFSDENAKRIDGMLSFLRESHLDETLARDELHVLLSALIDAADRVANISGTYGAFLKSWQRNALSTIQLRAPEITLSSERNQAYQRDANELVRELKGDILYIDPPYNDRQYAANYHILEILAEHHRVPDPAAYEAALYGKTGLRPYDELKSLYCVAPSPRTRGENVLSAMTDLILSARVDHVLVSYSEEGLMTSEELGSILSRFAGTRAYDFSTGMRSVLYRRFCSDSDRSGGDEKGKREYKVLDGKRRGQTSEWLLIASRPNKKMRQGKAKRPAARAGT